MGWVLVPSFATSLLRNFDLGYVRHYLSAGRIIALWVETVNVQVFAVSLITKVVVLGEI